MFFKCNFWTVSYRLKTMIVHIIDAIIIDYESANLAVNHDDITSLYTSINVCVCVRARASFVYVNKN